MRIGDNYDRYDNINYDYKHTYIFNHVEYENLTAPGKKRSFDSCVIRKSRRKWSRR
jgi:hypothetical protein